MEPIVAYIQQRVTEMFASWPIKAKVEVSYEDDLVVVDIKTNHDELFIQPKADPLLALQHLVRLMVRHQFPDAALHLTVNIGDFHQRQRGALRRVALEAIDQVKRTSAPVHLPPMSSFERRIVHMVVAEQGEAISESAGVGPGRRVVVKPS